SLRDGEAREIEDGRRRPLLRINEIEFVIGHAGGEGPQLRIFGNQLDLHRTGGVRRVPDHNRAGDGSTGEIPDPDTPAQVRLVTAVDMESEQGADKVTSDHE